ncbi:hypothetical protein Ancab_000860 [Ancistrocladus abbreviatus]
MIRPPSPRLQQQQPQPYHHPREGLTSEMKPVGFNLISSTAWKPKSVYPQQHRPTTPLTSGKPETSKPSPTQPAFRPPTASAV